jgi:hypothetical protein
MNEPLRFHMAEMTPADAAQFLRNACQTTAENSRDWDNLQAILEQFVTDAYKGGLAAGRAAAEAEIARLEARFEAAQILLSGRGDSYQPWLSACKERDAAIAKAEADRRDAERLRALLHVISEFANKTLIADPGKDDSYQAGYSVGAHRAFEQCAALAARA